MVRPPTHPAILRFVFLGALAALLAGVSTVSAQGGAPDTPDKPAGNAVFIGGVDLEWNDVSGADSYEVQLFTNGQWTLLPANGVEIAFYGAGAIISELDPAATIWIRVRARNAHGASDWSNYFQLASTSQYPQGRQPRPDNVAASGATVINGTAQVLETLTVDTSGIEDSNGLARVQFRFQWISINGGTDTVITNATDSSYTLATADEGNTIKVRVDFTDRGGYSESLTSAATASVTSAVEGSSGGETPQNSPATGAPTISGTTQVGETLTADTSGIADSDGLTNVSYSYQWIANDGNSDSVVTDATGSSYTLGAADEGKTIKVRVDFTDDAGNAETLTSASTSSVAARPNHQATGAPTISGTAQVGETLTADTSGIADSDGLTNVSYSYQWISNDGNSDSGITDATGSSYTLVAADEGKTIKVRVDFTDDAGNAETLTSATTGAVAGAPLPVNPLVPPSNETNRRVLRADANSLDGALNVFWDAYPPKFKVNRNTLDTVDFDRYLVAWKSGDEEFQTDLDGDRVKVVMGRNSNNTMLEGLTNGTDYTVRVTHANAVGAADHHSRTSTATPIARERVLVSTFSQGLSHTWGLPLDLITGNPGKKYAYNRFTAGPSAANLGSVTFARIQPSFDSSSPTVPKLELHLLEDLPGGEIGDSEFSQPGQPGSLIGKFVSPPEYHDGPAKFVAPGDGFALSASTDYWLKLVLVQGEVVIPMTMIGGPDPHNNLDPDSLTGWDISNACQWSLIDIWKNQHTQQCSYYSNFMVMLNSPIESTLPLASISGGSAVEGDNVEFKVELSSAPSAQATIQYDTVDGSAHLSATTSDNDYTAVSRGTITFAVGETSKVISIATSDDSTDEPNERFLVRLSNPSANIALSELDSAAGVIINNDQTTSSDSTLQGLTLTDQDGNTIALNKTFDPLKFVYTADAAASVDKMNLNVSFGEGVNPHYLRYFDAFGRVKEGTKAEASSAEFSRVGPGRNSLKVLITSNDRSRESLYKVMVTKAASSDATIATLVLQDDELNDFVLSPAFNSSVTEYTATIENNPPFYVDVGLSHGGADAEVSVNGTVVIPYSLGYPADTFEMPAGQNTIAIEVTAEDGTVQTYTITLVPPAAPSRPTIESVAHNSVTIAWDDPGDTSITGYQVLRRNPAIHGPGVFDVIEDDTGSSDTRYTDATVAPETTYRYRVKARNAQGLSEWSKPAARFTTPAEPTTTNTAATGLPTITGTPRVGVTLTADTSGISDSNGLTSVQYAYQWIRNDGNSDTNITGATGQTYTLTRDDQANTVKVSVSFTDDDGYSESLTSAATGTVAKPPNVGASGLPTISGTPQVGQTLTADTSGISDANGLTNVQYAYQWIRNDGNADSNITGATGQTYTLTRDDQGNIVKVSVSFTDDDGYSESLTSAATASVAQLPNAAPSGLPTIKGTAEVGESLTADTSGISDTNGLNNVQFAYKWMRNDGTSDEDISDATGQTYTLTDDDSGKAVKVQVNFNDDDGYAEMLTSAPTGTVAAVDDQESTYVELSGGSFHMCGITTGGSLHCWGEGNRGQTDAPEGEYKTLASGSAHTCAIATDGSISCWGWDTFSQATPPAGTFKSIASHSRHSCAIAVDDTIACWGYDSFHQNASPAGTYKSMAIGWEHTCTIMTDDTISCWGLNDQGQGNFPTGAYKAITAGFVHTCAIKSDDSIICRGMNNRGQTEAPAGSYVSISAGEYHTCAIDTDGAIDCWGDSSSGKTDAPGGTYKSIVARDYHTCAIATDDSVSCWGSNGEGQTDAPAGAFTATALSTYHTCGIATDGSVKCWGWNVDARSNTPSGTYESAVMGRDHACAIATDNTISCWGYNEFGQGDAPVGTYQHLAAGFDHTCAIATDDSIACWGYSRNGQTGAPSGTYHSIVAGDDHTCAIGTDDSITCWGLSANDRTNAPTGTYKAISAGSAHTCAIATDDTIACWGDSRNGRTDAPTGTYQSISAGDDHSCAVATDSSVACWGSNASGKSRAPDGAYQSVIAGEYHTCAITTDDTVTCWGYNKYGQTDAPAGTYRSVSIGEFHACAVATDNTVVCWGNERGGRCDAPTGTYQSIVVHTDHTLAIATDGALVAWPGLPEGVTWISGDQ